STTEITEAEVGGTLTLTLSWDEVMDTSVDPTVTLTPLPEGLTLASAEWDGNDYVVTWNIGDADVDLTTVALSVTGAQDLAGNAQNPVAEAEALTFDTHSPVVVAEELTGTVTEIADGADGENDTKIG